jgi:hypothetical protein
MRHIVDVQVKTPFAIIFDGGWETPCAIIFGGGMLVAFAIGFWRTRRVGFLLLTIGTALQFVEFYLESRPEFFVHGFRSIPDAISTILLVSTDSLNMVGAFLLAFSMSSRRRDPTI